MRRMEVPPSRRCGLAPEGHGTTGA